MWNDKFFVLNTLNAAALLFSIIVLSLLAGWASNTQRDFDILHPTDLFLTTTIAVVSGMFSSGNIIPSVMRRLGYSKFVYMTQRILAGSWFLAFMSMTLLENKSGILDKNLELTSETANVEAAILVNRLANVIRVLTIFNGCIYVGLSYIVYKISVGRGLSNLTKLEKFIRHSQYILRNSQCFFRNSQSGFRQSMFANNDTLKSQPTEVVIRVPDRAFTKETREDEKQVYACALYDYNGSDEVDLRFKEGEVIRVTKYSRNQNEWWEGEVNGQYGEFPGTYVKVV
ncbi:1924_t:CDS:2 [Paraglomus brasilianum]|uniref:1924_t:CDS:1 n=1 Tax=Paraglomus brasilianum TaxID=144538 RepID=A0A9N9FLD9_9GLOM|nr:1924_t:CDS:2 [Paraglomus brasilianum]